MINLDLPLGVALLHLIMTPHTLHIHIRLTSYLYNVLQHLLLWLVVIRMHPNLIELGFTDVRGGDSILAGSESSRFETVISPRYDK